MSGKYISFRGVRQVEKTASSTLLPERIVRSLSQLSWFYLLIAWALAFVSGIIGFYAHYAAQAEPCSLVRVFYSAAQLMLLNASLPFSPLNPFLGFAAVFVPALFLFTASAALAALFRSKLEALVRRAYYVNHVVICGLGRKGWLFVRKFRKSGSRVTVIEKNPSNAMIRECEKMLVPVLIGNAEDPGLLEDAQVVKADRIICVCGEDGTNVEIAFQMQHLVAKRTGRALKCLVHVFSPRLCSLLRTKAPEMVKISALRVDMFNVFHTGALMLINDVNSFGKMSVAYTDVPHLLIVGLGWFGESIIIEAAKKWRPRYEVSDEKLRITAVDREATRKSDHLWSRYRGLREACEFRSIDMDIESREFLEAEFLSKNSDSPPVSIVYVCLDDQSLGLTAAMNLRQEPRTEGIPIVLRANHDSGLAKIPWSTDGIRFFSLYESTCSQDPVSHEMLESIARAIHEDYVASLQNRGITIEEKPLLKPWDQLTEEEKESSRRPAGHIPAKLNRIHCATAHRSNWSKGLFQFTSQEVEILAEMEHARWCDEKRAEGYHFGARRDDANRTHDCLVPWNQLSERDKETDRAAIRDLPGILATVDLEICRLPEP